MPKFRWRCGRRKGQWHPTRADAERAATREGLGYIDPVREGMVFLSPMVEIEEESDG